MSGQDETTGLRGRVMVTTQAGADLMAVSLMFVFVMAAVALSVMPVVTTELRTSIGLTDAQIGLLTSVFMGFYGAAGISSGIGAARWGGRLLGVSCGCLVAGSLVFALSSGFGGFLAGRAIQGIGGGMVVATCNPVMAHALPREWIGRAWGIVGCGFGIGTIFALFALPAVAGAGGYRAVFLVIAGLGLAIGVAALSQRAVRALPCHPEGTTGIRGLAVSVGAVLKNRRVVILALCNTAGLGLGLGTLAWTPSFLQDIHDMPETASMYLIAGMGAAQVIANPLGAAAAGRWGKYWVIVVSIVVMLVATVLVGLMPGAVLAAAMVLIAGFFGMFYFPAMLGYIPEVVAKPEQVGPGTGVNTLMGFIGSLVAPWIFGLLLDAGSRSGGSYVSGYLMLGVFGVVALIALALFRAPKAPAHAGPPSEGGD
ncbi:MAG: MFS transporter [Thermoleophilia bacterium]|nr:MFS transporter [Thermoleophilia bacterium]